MSIERVVLDALREVEDLDEALTIYCANDAADQCPAIQKWIRTIVDEERRRRGGEDSPEFTYSQAGIEVVDGITLSSIGVFASGAIEWAYLTNKPTLIKFAVELNKSLVITMAKRLIDGEIQSMPTG